MSQHDEQCHDRTPLGLTDIIGCTIVDAGMDYPVFWILLNTGKRVAFTVDEKVAPHDCFSERVCLD
jgi:hypothetical protein